MYIQPPNVKQTSSPSEASSSLSAQSGGYKL